jgi:hypothetical protein
MAIRYRPFRPRPLALSRSSRSSLRLPLLELLNQPDPAKKFDQNRQAPKRGNSAQRVADFDLSSTKKRPKFLPIVLFRRLKGMFSTTHSLINACNSTRLIYLGLNSDFGFKVLATMGHLLGVVAVMKALPSDSSSTGSLIRWRRATAASRAFAKPSWVLENS